MILPYLRFNGSCEEALHFYAGVFGGSIQHMARYGDMPENPAMPLTAEQKSMVMHAQLMLTEAGGLSGADALWPVEPGGAVSIQAHLGREAEAQRAFAALAEGGSIVSPLVANPPPDDSGVSGCVKDKYGFVWILSAMEAG